MSASGGRTPQSGVPPVPPAVAHIVTASKSGASSPINIMPSAPPSPMLRASSYKSADGSIAPLRRSSSFGSNYSHGSDHIPASEGTIDPLIRGDDLKEIVLKMLIKLKLTSWKLSDAPKVAVKNIASALTNMVYRIGLGEKRFLLRIYGRNVLHLIDREYETSVLARLAQHHIGPRLLGQFKNGRIEQWLDSTEVGAAEVRDPETSRYIARRMREFHDHIGLVPRERGKLSCLVNFDSWAPALPHHKLTSAFRRFLGHITDYRHWLEKEGLLDGRHVSPTEIGAELVLCHNDLQYGNLLRVDGQEHLSLAVIDFEYAGPNPRAFDLANHLCEWMADYHASPAHVQHADRYATAEQVDNFLREYLRFGRVIRHDPRDDRHVDAVPEEEIAGLRKQVDIWRPLAHAQWAVWGVVQALPGEEVGTPVLDTHIPDHAQEPERNARLQRQDSDKSVPSLSRHHSASSARKVEPPGMRSPFLGPKQDAHHHHHHASRRQAKDGANERDRRRRSVQVNAASKHGDVIVEEEVDPDDDDGAHHRLDAAGRAAQDAAVGEEEYEYDPDEHDEAADGYFSLGLPAMSTLSLSDTLAAHPHHADTRGGGQIDFERVDGRGIIKPRHVPSRLSSSGGSGANGNGAGVGCVSREGTMARDDEWIDEDSSAEEAGFDYLAFSRQKCALFYKDLVQAGRLARADVPAEFATAL